MIVFTFGNKLSIEKTYEVVKLSIENENLHNSNLDIEALVTDQILATEVPLPAPEFNYVIKSKQFINLTLADSSSSNE